MRGPGRHLAAPGSLAHSGSPRTGGRSRYRAAAPGKQVARFSPRPASLRSSPTRIPPARPSCTSPTGRREGPESRQAARFGDRILDDAIALHHALPPRPTGKRGRLRRRPGHNCALRLRKRKAEPLCFLSGPRRVPFTSNEAERDHRMAKLRQKISGRLPHHLACTLLHHPAHCHPYRRNARLERPPDPLPARSAPADPTRPSCPTRINPGRNNRPSVRGQLPGQLYWEAGARATPSGA